MGLVESLKKYYDQGSGVGKSGYAVAEEKTGRKAERDRKDSEIVLNLGQKWIFPRIIRCKSRVQSSVEPPQTSGNIQGGHKGAIECPIKK